MNHCFAKSVRSAWIAAVASVAILATVSRTSVAQQPAQTDPTLARGRAAFDRVCGRCHPHGNADVGRRLIGLHWTEDRVRTQVRHGRGTMRPISLARMSDTDLTDVMVYLRSIGTVR